MSMNLSRFERKSAIDRADDAVELNAVVEALKKRDDEIKTFAEKATAEIKANAAMSAETKASLEKLAQDGVAQAERMRELEQKLSRRSFGAPERKTAGQRVTESDEFKAVAAKNGGVVRIEVKANELNSSTTDANGSVGDAIQPHRLPGILQPAERAPTIRSLLLPGRTSSDQVEYVQRTGFTNAAATVAEMGTSQQSTLKFDLKTTPVVDISHHVIASRNVLRDIPMLQSYIDVTLRYGLAMAEEEQLLIGDGIGTNMLGIVPQASEFNETLYSQVNDTRIDTIRRAALQVRLAEHQATWVAMNPVDWSLIETTKGTDGHYVFVHVQTGATPQLWRLRIVETTAIPVGEFLVGSTDGAQIWDREDAAVEVATQHSDFRLDRKVVIIGEQRLALTVTRPESYVYGSFELGGVGGSPDSINI